MVFDIFAKRDRINRLTLVLDLINSNRYTGIVTSKVTGLKIPIGIVSLTVAGFFEESVLKEMKIETLVENKEGRKVYKASSWSNDLEDMIILLLLTPSTTAKESAWKRPDGEEQWIKVPLHAWIEAREKATEVVKFKR